VADLVSDVQRKGSHRCRGGDAQCYCQDTQQLAPKAARQGFEEDSDQHLYWKYFAAPASAGAAMRIASPSTR